MRGLTGCAVGLCAFGFVAPAFSISTGQVAGLPFVGGIFLSVTCCFCLLLSNASAANAQKMFGTGKWVSGWLSVAVFVGGACVSMTSMHMGWKVFSGWADDYPLPSDEQMGWAFAFVAFVKPAVNWTIQALKDLQAAQEADASRMAKDEAMEREARQRAAEERRKGFSAVPAGAALALGMLAQSPDAVPDVPPAVEMRPEVPVASHSTAQQVGMDRPAPMGLSARDREKFETVRELFREGVRSSQIISHVQVPKTTGYRWIAYLRETPLVAVA